MHMVTFSCSLLFLLQSSQINNGTTILSVTQVKTQKMLLIHPTAKVLWQTTSFLTWITGENSPDWDLFFYSLHRQSLLHSLTKVIHKITNLTFQNCFSPPKFQSACYGLYGPTLFASADSPFPSSTTHLTACCAITIPGFLPLVCELNQFPSGPFILCFLCLKCTLLIFSFCDPVSVLSRVAPDQVSP